LYGSDWQGYVRFWHFSSFAAAQHSGRFWSEADIG
jgi:hypothetical protein